MTEKITPFHIAIPVHNLDECRTFYREILGCEEGR
ncbi:MAG: glyoxalase, partial [Muricauda sp.]|nr:glyoxalase [Allomuricauda sp.]